MVDSGGTFQAVGPARPDKDAAPPQPVGAMQFPVRHGGACVGFDTDKPAKQEVRQDGGGKRKGLYPLPPRQQKRGGGAVTAKPFPWLMAQLCPPPPSYALPAVGCG